MLEHILVLPYLVVSILNIATDEALQQFSLTSVRHSKDGEFDSVPIGPGPLILLKDALCAADGYARLA